MKQLFFSWLAMFCSIGAIAQDSAPTQFNGAGTFSRVMGMQPDLVDGIHRVSGLKFSTSKRVEGSPFQEEIFNPGYIVFFNEKMITDISLRYNDLNNELYFEDGGQALILQTAFREFGYTVKREEGSYPVVYRNGFPATDISDDKTFYRVLSGNRLFLLKLINKKVHEVKEPNGMEFLRIKTTETYYAYDKATNSMISFKPGTTSLRQALPAHSVQIADISKQLNLKCKSEKELSILFAQLK